jgi:hypothetical protein
VTVRRLHAWIEGSGFQLVREDRHVTGFFRRVLPGPLRRRPRGHALHAGRDDRPHPVRAAQAVSPAAASSLEVLVPADIRFPLERANGVQIVKTAAALSGAGARTTLVVRQSDPRPTAEILALFGVAPHPGLRVRRLQSCTAGGPSRCPARRSSPAPLSSPCPPCAAAPSCSRAISSSRTSCSPARRPRVVYEAHAVEALMYGERAALYGTEEKANPRKQERLRGREGRVWRGAAAVVTTTAGIRDSFAEAYGERPRVHVVPNGCDPPETRVHRACPRASRRSSTQASSIPGRAWTCWWRPSRRCPAGGS